MKEGVASHDLCAQIHTHLIPLMQIFLEKLSFGFVLVFFDNHTEEQKIWLLV